MHDARTVTRCYRQGGGVLAIIGGLLIGAGLLLLFLCVPGWAWAALGGAALIAAGWLLIRISKGGR